MPAQDTPSGQSPGSASAEPGIEQTKDRKVAVVTDAALSKVAKFVVSIGSPLALITALMFYFGWVRTQVQARELGYDVAVLQLSTTDYLLKSVNVLFPVAVATLLLVIGGYAIYEAALERFTGRDDQGVVARRAYRGTGAVAIAALVAGAICFAIPATRFAAIPVALTVALLCVFARGKLRPLVGKPRWGTTGQVLILVLLSLLLFWDTERIAGALGQQFAADIAAYPDQFPEVIVYSKYDLHIEAEGVLREEIGTAEGGYRFRHTGLRLMEQAGEKYVLINEIWYDGRGRIIVLTDAPDVRFEFIDRY